MCQRSGDGWLLVLSWNNRRMSVTVLEEDAERWFDYRTFGALQPRLRVERCGRTFAFLKKTSERTLSNGGAIKL